MTAGAVDPPRGRLRFKGETARRAVLGASQRTGLRGGAHDDRVGLPRLANLRRLAASRRDAGRAKIHLTVAIDDEYSRQIGDHGIGALAPSLAERRKTPEHLAADAAKCGSGKTHYGARRCIYMSMPVRRASTVWMIPAMSP